LSDETPFSRPVKVETLPHDGLDQRVEADAAERAELAKRFGLVDLAELVGDFHIERLGREARVTGEVDALVTQTCVVTLEPFDERVTEEVDVRFAPPADGRKMPAAKKEETVNLDDDEPDPIVDGKIDLGALAAEFLALGLDPYPRKPGVEFEAPVAEEDDDSPFAPLTSLKPMDRT
jgi:uncharacterized metal-binding protein YceD (DUF177 family)